MAKKVKRKLVTPRTLKGFQDHLPEAAIARNDAITKIRDVYESYGFAPIDTPTIEHIETLVGAGGEETNKQMFRLESPEGDEIALRFDLTVPFARLIAQYPEDLKPPVRRYHIGSVYRADKPGPGRFRQFTQCDIDIAGCTSVAADAEVIAAMCDVLKALGLEDFNILINNRKLLDALMLSCNVLTIEKHKHVLRVIDKLSKVGLDNIRRELAEGRIDDSGDPIPGVGLDAETIEKIVAFIGLKADGRSAVVDAVAELLPESKETDDAVSEMRELADSLAGLKVSEDHAVFDPSLARGLDYYTGPVFEIMLPGAPEFGSVGGGGRYDGLVSRFLPQPIAATGFSVGLDRLLAALTHVGVVRPTPTVTDVLVVTMRHVEMKDYLALAAELRAAGLRTEVYMGRRKDGVSQQLSYANKKRIPVAIIMGGDEFAAGEVSIKDLDEGKQAREGIDDRDAYREAGTAGQSTIKHEEMIDAVKALLER